MTNAATAPGNLSLRQMLEGMTLVFDAEAAGNMDASIQFDITGERPATYHLRIHEGDCRFALGPAAAPTLTITTPADVWLGVSRGELDGQQALMSGQYQAQGDLSLLLRFNALFRNGQGAADSAYAAPADAHPSGPIPLSGMAWMTAAFIPWTIFWVLFDIPTLSPWLRVGLPFALAAAVVAYRLAFDRPTWLEWGGFVFFALAGMLTLAADPTFARWGSALSSAFSGLLWLTSIVWRRLPLCAEYSRWGFSPRLWRTTLFLHPNAAISLTWGGQYLLATGFAVGATLLPAWYGPLTGIRFLLLAPAFAFTAIYSRNGHSRYIADVDQAMTNIRRWAYVGIGLFLIVAVGIYGWL
jgi:putative sterol carrier protein